MVTIIIKNKPKDQISNGLDNLEALRIDPIWLYSKYLFMFGKILPALQVSIITVVLDEFS